MNTEPCKIKERDKQRAGRAKYAPAFLKSWFQERERERERQESISRSLLVRKCLLWRRWEESLSFTDYR